MSATEHQLRQALQAVAKGGKAAGLTASLTGSLAGGNEGKKGTSKVLNGVKGHGAHAASRAHEEGARQVKDAARRNAQYTGEAPAQS